MRRSLKGPLIGALLGLLVVVLGLEIGLRILGSRYPLLDASRAGSSQVEACPECRRILCVGDSYTYGIGATAGHDFPTLLQGRLAADRGPVRVFNAGIPGANTGYILAALPDHLALTQPEAVVVLAGGANRHNLFGLEAFQQRSSVGAQIEAWTYRIRVVRFLRNAITRMRNQRADHAREGGAPDLLRDTSGPELYARWRARDGRPVDDRFVRAGQLLAVGDLEGAQALYEAGAQAQPDDAAWLWGQAECARGRRDYEGARQLYERAIALDPHDPVSHYALGELFQDQDDPGNPGGPEAFRAGIAADPTFARNYCGLGRWAASFEQDLAAAAGWFEKGIEADPSDALCYSQMAATVHGTQYADRLQALLERHAEAGTEVEDLLHYTGPRMAATTMDAWIRDDLTRIVTLSEQAGARVILQTYPQQWAANSVIRDVAAETSATLVDMERELERMAADGQDVARLTIADGHYSDMGNDIVAAALVEAMESH